MMVKFSREIECIITAIVNITNDIITASLMLMISTLQHLSLVALGVESVFLAMLFLT